MATFVENSSLTIDRRSPFGPNQGGQGESMAFYVRLPAPRRARDSFESYSPEPRPDPPVNVLVLATGSARIAPLAHELLRAGSDSDSRSNRLRELHRIDRENPAAERDRGVVPDVILTRLQTNDDDVLAPIARLRMVWCVPVIATLTLELALGPQLLAEALDDFLMEPTAPEELLIRIHCAVCRRRGRPRLSTRDVSQAAADDIGLRIDDESKSVSLFGSPLQLTPKEFELLRLLASESGRVFSDAEIIGKLWPNSPHAAPVDVAQYVHRLRKKLHDDPCAPQWIFNIKRFGYMLKRIPTRSDSRSSQ